MAPSESSALVTGAGRGIGRAIALELSRQGALVYLAARDERQLVETQRLIEAERGRAIVAMTDITQLGDVERLKNTVAAATSTLDVLVCNSGIAGPSAPLWEVEPSDWDETFAVNVRGTYLCCRALLPLMIAARRGSIVVIGSMTGRRPLLNRTPYAASKMALVGLVRTLASEVAPHGIRVNLVSPGFVAGDRIEWVIERQAESWGLSRDEVRAYFEAASPMARLVTPSEVAQAVAFLASSAASGITGQDLNVTTGTLMH